jgi:hypothetical protein
LEIYLVASDLETPETNLSRRWKMGVALAL